MSRRDVKAILIGLAWFVGFFGSSVAFGALGYWLWDDMGMMLALTPVGTAFVLIGAYQIGDSWLDDRHIARFASEAEIRTAEAEVEEST